MGGAFGPRNIALDHINGEYLMFIDSDNTYPQDACETLYNKINEYDCDIAFGRYLRHYPEKNLIRKSYTPYIDSLEKPYADYTGEYMDSPFMFNLETRRRAKPNPPPVKEEIVLTDDFAGIVLGW